MDWKLLNAVVDLAVEAGEAIMQVYEGDDFAIEEKSDGSPLTAADLAAHEILESGLRALASETPVLSEESATISPEIRSLWNRYWLVDPLDGTAEFVNRNGEFTVNVALIEHHCPILGVVYVPTQGVIYLGARGLGAFRRDAQGQRSINTRSIDGLKDQQEHLVVMVSRRHGDTEMSQLIERFQRQIGPCETKSVGSSLKICLIAEGLADIYPRLGPTSEWDTAAAQAVLEAAGGALIDEDLRVLRYNAKADLLNPFFYAIGDTGYDWPKVIG